MFVVGFVILKAKFIGVWRYLRKSYRLKVENLLLLEVSVSKRRLEGVWSLLEDGYGGLSGEKFLVRDGVFNFREFY